nr:MAG TPA: hypothetical protein [Caudoviricetes sp.]
MARRIKDLPLLPPLVEERGQALQHFLPFCFGLGSC